ncbi:MAG: 6-phosphofructokinase [Lachnospiraceae bacterium]|nr:6-phosphofructokinase [Lachnospiraceae bacterium]
MPKGCKKIAVLTSGGDAPGMNAAIRAVVRRALGKGLKVVGIEKGYKGLLAEEMFDMNARSVADAIQKGGTILGTARSSEFATDEGKKKAADILRKRGIEGVAIIGGDGSYRGALGLSREGIPVVCIPGTIDLDIACTDYTIGFDTAVNTAMEAIDKVRDTSSSHERCSIIEVMGRNAGYIALWCGVATGAEDILLPEKYDFNEQNIINHIIESRKLGKTHHLIINAEGIGHSTSMSRRIEAATGMETRATILGYMQRGGSPSCKDRFYAAIMGAYAADLLEEGNCNRCIGYLGGEFRDFDIEEALNMKKEIPEYYYDVSKALSRSIANDRVAK